jgi:hypothetical protein
MNFQNMIKEGLSSFPPNISIGIPYPMSSLSNHKTLEKDKVV